MSTEHTVDMNAPLELGECWYERTPEGIQIVQADPKIMVAAHIVEEIRRFGGYLGGFGSIDGDLLRLRGINRTVIYRIGEKVPDRLAYYAEWPD